MSGMVLDEIAKYGNRSVVVADRIVSEGQVICCSNLVRPRSETLFQCSLSVGILGLQKIGRSNGVSQASIVRMFLQKLLKQAQSFGEITVAHVRRAQSVDIRVIFRTQFDRFRERGQSIVQQVALQANIPEFEENFRIIGSLPPCCYEVG